MPTDKQPTTVAVHWTRFGPYHLARLSAAYQQLQPRQIHLIGLEVASLDNTYEWRPEKAALPFDRQIVFPEQTYDQINIIALWREMWRTLSRLQPQAVAVSGYMRPDSQAALAWCRLHRRPAVLMTESKVDDQPRQVWRERVKQAFVTQFTTALVGGRPHQHYLEQLGMPASRIFLGYDAVDNAYFQREAAQVRQQPETVRPLLGLEQSAPYFLASARFIPRKNLDGLLRAYARYRQLVAAQQPDRQPWGLVILGDGVERERLQQLAHQLNLTNICWPGFRQIDELPAYYGLAGAFIHPAHQEQWGLVVNEAMAAGLPVLVSKTCGCAPDLVIDGQTGFTFEPNNYEQLAILMACLSSDQVDRQALGQAAQAHIADWGPARFADGLYEAVHVALSQTNL